MGIFKFTSTYAKHTSTTIDFRSIDRLYIDGNCLIYVAAACINDMEDKQCKCIPDNRYICNLCKHISNECITLLDKLVSMYRDDIYVMLTIDGIAPLGKINKQISSRQLRAIRKMFEDEIYNKHNILPTNWSNCCITPGTQFMDYMHKVFDSYCKQHGYDYSSHLEKGEGEHKIISSIHALPNKQKTSNIVIFSPDSDVYFLLLLADMTHIYIHRDIEENHVYDIRKFAKLIPSELNIYEFSFIFMHFGNDFIPCMPQLHLSTMKVTICNVLITCKQELDIGCLIDRNLILNIPLYICFINRLASTRDVYNNIINKINRKEPIVTNSSLTNELNQLELLRHPDYLINDRIRRNDFNWMNRYYSEDDNISDMVHSYIKTMLWTMDYYIHNKSDSSYYYPYSKAPLLEDIITYMPRNNNAYHIPKDNFNPDANWCLIKTIPNIYTHILPSELINKCSPLVDINDIDINMAVYLWQVIITKKSSLSIK